MKRNLNHSKITGLLLTALLFALVLAPTSALADTAAGTTITNTATVTWTGGSNSDTADIVVQLLEVTPVLTYVSTVPGTTVGEGTPTTITYTLTSAANGSDSYTLGSSIAGNANFTGTPGTTVNGGTASINLGASQVVSVVEAGGNTTITLPAGSASHGLIANTSSVLINGTLYPVTVVNDAGPEITVAGIGYGFSAGDLIQEQISFTVTFTAGTLNAVASAVHAVTTTAGNGATADASDLQNVTVTATALTISKQVSNDGGAIFANSVNAQPGDTLTYRIEVTNSGTVDALNVQITDTIPTLYTSYVATSARWNNAAATTYAASAANSLTDASDSPADEYNFTGSTATYGVGSMAPGAVAVLLFQVTVQ